MMVVCPTIVQTERRYVQTKITLVRSALARVVYGAQHPAVQMFLAMRQAQTAAAARMAQNNAMDARRRPVQKVTGRTDPRVLQIRFVAVVRVSLVQVASMYRATVA